MKALEIRQLKKIYRGRFVALHGIDLDVSSGDFFALLGPNGAGKSTTIGIIASLVNPTSGTVSVFGHDLVHERQRCKSLIGLVPQEINFNQFERVQDILIHQAGLYGVARREARLRAAECLRTLDLWDKRNTVSRHLSGGMKRRLMIARALMHRPQLLILDEPTAGVDIEVRRSMWKFLRALNQNGTTIILTTHYLEEAESLCRNIAIIDHGRIVEHSTMPTLLGKLHTQSFVLELQTPVPAAPHISGCSVTMQDSATLIVEVPRAMGLNQLFSCLTAQGIEVVGLRNKQNRLEQLFLDLLDRSAYPLPAEITAQHAALP